MSAFDIVVLFLTVALGFKGLLRGFVKETCGLIALIGGIYIASTFAADAATFLKDFGLSITTASVVGFLVLFVAVWLLVTYIASIVAKALSITGLGAFDNALGFLAGAAKVYVILSVIVFAVLNVAFVKPKVESYTKDSMFAPSMTKIGAIVMNLKPSDLSTQTIVDAIQNESNLTK